MKGVFTLIRVFTQPNCQQCRLTEQFLNQHHIQYLSVDITKHSQYRSSLLNQGFHTTPIVMTDNAKWTGFRPDRLNNLVKTQRLSR